jgi:dephospho-CoA kinase
MNRPRQVGVTGGIGAGKSLICKVFAALGVPVYDADSRAKWLINHDILLQKQIVELLGPAAFEQGVYNRQWVATQVFDNPELLQKLNAIVHPRVFVDSAEWLQRHRACPYVLRESALTAKTNDIDQLIVVQAPLALRIQRIKQRDPHRSEAEIMSIIARQPTDEARLAAADYVIANDDTQLLIPQIEQLHALLMKNA